MATTKQRSKFNVQRDKDRRTHKDIVFDSVMEMKYYRDVLCPLVESGEVIKYELQKPYELQPGFVRMDKAVKPVTYVADFYMQYRDGSEVVVDIKGCPDSVATLKRKLFWYKYRDLDYRWITYVEKYGGWVLYEYAKKKRNEARKLNKQAKASKEGKDGE